jgi:aldose 1-epimerase
MNIGGAPVVFLERAGLERPAPPAGSDHPSGRPAFTSAVILPGRGMMPLQIQAHLPGRGVIDLLTAPSLQRSREILEGEAGDFPGNSSYLLGGALLIPYANRIRGKLAPDGRTIEAALPGGTVRLPANAGGRRPGAERYAMHGLLLDARVEDVRRETTEEADRVLASFQAGDFGGRWPSSTELSFENVLRDDSFTLAVTARNAGSEPLPIGIGWHPYFNVPSGRREQARLHIPACRRVLVNDYDEVLPTGELEAMAGTPYDFSPPGGRALGSLFLDDCFVDLDVSPQGEVVVELIDPEAAYGLRIVAVAPPVRAVQVYGPPDRAFFAIEPQLNWADPFGPQWGPDIDTGMVMLEPRESVTYSVRLELFTP